MSTSITRKEPNTVLVAMLNDARIPSERQWVVTTKQSRYILDFAIFCKTKPIDVECDGDAWHDQTERVYYDKHRNNELESHGRSVLRFTQDDIKHRLERTASLLHHTINRIGGYQVVNEPTRFSYVQRGDAVEVGFLTSHLLENWHGCWHEIVKCHSWMNLSIL